MKQLMLIAATLVATLTVGCAENSVISGRYDFVAAYPNITLAQNTLDEAIRFQEPIITRTDNDLLSVITTLRSLSNEPLHLEYRMIWLDDHGRPIGPDMSWRPIRVENRQVERISVTSTSPAAMNWNLQIRWGRP